MNVTASAEGSLYELVCRGKKDKFLFEDSPNSRFIFDNSYEHQPETIFERRVTPPRTNTEFGRMVEFDIYVTGDIIKSFTILIDLPSWLPPSIASTFNTTSITDSSGNTYGYINGIAYFLFENIQFYQDNILLQEFSGDALWTISRTEGSYAERFITAELTGIHNGSKASIGKNAIPGQLRLTLPIIGCQKNGPGFPIRAMMNHTFRIKCNLRKLEDLVESSNTQTTSIKATPWGKTGFLCNTKSSSQTFNTLDRTSIGPLILQLETIQVYVTSEMQKALMTIPMEIPFIQIYENTFTQNMNDYSGSALVSRRLDGRHPSPRLLWIFRNLNDIQANLRWKSSTNNSGPYYNTISLLIAGKTRESEWDSSLWRDVVNFAKEKMYTTAHINTMNWGLGSVIPGIDLQQANGSVNFTTADRPTFNINLQIPSGDQLPPAGTTLPAELYNTSLLVITEGWTSLQTSGKGRAELLSLN